MENPPSEDRYPWISEDDILPAVMPGAPAPDPKQPNHLVPYSAPAHAGILLKLKRSLRSGTLGKVYFALDARIEVTAEDRSLIEKYTLGAYVVYDSAARQRHMDSTEQHLGETHGGVGKTFYRLARASASRALAALSLRVTIKSLLEGVHIECKDLNELMGAEKAIVEAAENLKSYLELAATFDGREEVIQL